MLTKNIFLIASSLLWFVPTLLPQSVTPVPTWVSYIPNTNLSVRDAHSDCAENIIYVSGTTLLPDFPVSNATAYQATFGGNRDGYLAVLSPDLSTILYATFIGGSGSDNLRACHVDNWGRVHAGGISASLMADKRLSIKHVLFYVSAVVKHPAAFVRSAASGG